MEKEDNLETTVDSPAVEAAAPKVEEQSAQETQPDSPTVPSEDTKEEGVAPWESDPRFKGKEAKDIWKAYQEAQGLMTKTSQKAKIADLLEQKYGISPDKLTKIIEQREADDKQRQIAENPVAHLGEEVMNIKQQLALEKEQLELEKFIASDTGKQFDGVKEKIFRAAMTDPEYAEMSYEDIANDLYGGVIKNARQEAYQKIETKQSTQSTGVSRAEAKEITLDDMKNMSSAELEAILPKGNASDMTY